jgi:hypothetical protein
MSQLRSEIVVTVSDRDAQQALDEILRKLERARELSRDLGIGGGGGGGGAGGGGAGAGAGGTGAPAGNTTSTADPDDSDGTGRVKGGLGRRMFDAGLRGTEIGAGIMQTGHSNPAFSIQLFGRAVTGLTAALDTGLSKMIDVGGGIFESIPIFGSILSGGAATAAMAARVGSSLMNEATMMRYEKVMQLANIERPMAMARVTGGFTGGINSPFMGQAAALGFRPQEAAQMMASFSRSIGVAGGGAAAYAQGVDPFQAALSGMSPEMIARYVSLGGPGGGAVGGIIGAANAVQGTVGTVEHAGLRGAKVDEALARISSATTQMAEQGLNLNLANVNQAMSDLAATGKARGGQNVFSGMNAVRGALKLSQMGPSAAKQFSGGFGGLTTAAIQAYAFGQASTPAEAMIIMEDLAKDPMRARQVIIDQLGPEAGALAFAGSGFSMRQGQALAGPQEAGQVRRSMGGAGAGDVPYSAMLATQEQKLMAMVETNAAQNKAIIGSMQTIQKTMVRISEFSSEYLIKVDELLKRLTGYH